MTSMNQRNLSFRFDGEKELFCQSKEILEYLDRARSEKRKDSICSVTGENDQIAILHSSIKGVYGTQTTGGSIVSFNFDSALSYNLGSAQQHTQGKNASVGESAMFAYTTALNRLLMRESPQHLLIGDASTVFWSEKKRTLSQTRFLLPDRPRTILARARESLEPPRVAYAGSYRG